MFKKSLLVIFCTFFYCSFAQKSQTEIRQFFSQSEIDDLDLITDFFQQQLCGTNDRKLFGKCITSNISELADWDQEFLRKKISWRKQKKMYKSISDATFNKIWAICNSTYFLSKPEYQSKSICFSGNAQLIEYFKDLGKTNIFIDNYAKVLEATGSFSGVNQISFNLAEHPQQWDLEDRNIQIFLAFNYLTQNDRLKRDKKIGRLENRHERELQRNKK